jgi:CheY-like chemotaxis protein/HPt (histidine-containing phosphotransfer) domain-containing protein
MQQDLTCRVPTHRARFDACLLVVEDNAVNQDIAAGLLGRMKCHVTLAANGVEAVQMAAQTCFDLVLMDCEMPEMDGLAATRHIRQACPVRLPILAMTAHRSADIEAACRDAGMDDVLSKPLTFETVGTALRRWIGHLEIDAAPAKFLRAAAPLENSAAATTPDGCALDTNTLDNISTLRAADGAALLKRLIDRFSDTAPRLLTELRDCSARGDLGAVRVSAHSLRSASLALGASRLAALAGTIEKAGRDKDPATVASLTPLLGGEFEIALRELRLFAEQTS